MKSLEPCKNTHKFIEIYESCNTSRMDSFERVMWCRSCGAIRIDKRLSDMIIEGGVLRVNLPENLTRGKQHAD